MQCDNLSVKSIASNPIIHAHSKHIEIIVACIPTTDQIADYLAKPLTHIRFNLLRDKLNMTISLSVWKGNQTKSNILFNILSFMTIDFIYSEYQFLFITNNYNKILVYIIFIVKHMCNQCKCKLDD